MSEKTPVWFVCAPFPKVGASTFTRLLVDYQLLQRRELLLLDTDVHGRTLENWFPNFAQTIDLSTTPGQIAMFDQLLQAGPGIRIVEICASAYALFMSQARNIGFFEESERYGIDPQILFVSNGTRKAMEAGMTVQTLCRRVRVVPVVNEGFVRLGSKLNDHLDSFPSGRSFQVPPMDMMLRDAVDAPGFSLADFLKSPPPVEEMSLVVRADLRSWITRVFTQFRSHELRKAFDETTYLLRA